MSSDDVLLGLGLVLGLAVAAQLVARLTRLPAIVVLLPAGFLAGVVTDVVQPDRLLGDLYQPFVSIAVGMILFEAGLRLSFAGVAPAARRLVDPAGRRSACSSPGSRSPARRRCCSAGSTSGVALLIGAILVVSGPTVVLPLLAFVRPTRERPLAAHVGGRARRSGRRAARRARLPRGRQRRTWHPGEMMLSIARRPGRRRRRRPARCGSCWPSRSAARRARRSR